MDTNRRWKHRLAIGLLLAAQATVSGAQGVAPERPRVPESRLTPPPAKVVAVAVPEVAQTLSAQMPLGSEKLASYKTEAGWHYAFGSTDVRLPRDGSCLVTCSIDVQSHVQTGFLTFRTARLVPGSGESESDDGWGMDVPVPISQGSASSTYAWSMRGSQTYRFGCRTLADRGFLGIDVYPNVSWICR